MTAKHQSMKQRMLKTLTITTQIQTKGIDYTRQPGWVQLLFFLIARKVEKRVIA